MTSYCRALLAVLALGALDASVLFAQALGTPDRGQPGDEMIQAYLARLSLAADDQFRDDFRSRADWEQHRPRYRQEYLSMLGLWPEPERTPLDARVTGRVERDGYVVELLHYQSRPHLYVTANLYRPADIAPGQKLPAVLYVCGHSSRGRNGGKTAFQSHGIWFARHGYVCLIVDTLQLGEIAAMHHGTYREQRWWWHSRGYTSAGVECWNGVRGIDYLLSRPDVDPERLAVTGISGGGAATFWVAAADERVRAAVPVSGMADLEAYVANRVINGHCDCMFLHNSYAWPWTRIAGLVAPRPLLFVNSDQDAIFPMDANDRISQRLERLYSLYGAGDRMDTLVSVGGHDYRADIRQGVYRFLNAHLKGDAAPVTDGEADLVTTVSGRTEHPIPPEQLRVFPTDADVPADQLNTTIDEHFVPAAQPAPPTRGAYAAWRQDLLAALRRLPWRLLPERIPPAQPTDPAADLWETEPGIRVSVKRLGKLDQAQRVVLVVSHDHDSSDAPPALKPHLRDGDALVVVRPRGIGPTRWTQKNPPNYIERAHALLGRTVDLGRLWDVVAVARRLRSETDKPVWTAGTEGGAVLAGYAAVLDSDIAGAIAHRPSPSHQQSSAPQFLSILRVADVPHVLGAAAPKPLRLVGAESTVAQALRTHYAAADAAAALELVDE